MTAHRGVYSTVLALLLLASACSRGVESEDEQNGPGTAVAATGCTGGPTRPLTSEQVVRLFHRYGFSGSSSTSSDLCEAMDASIEGDDQAAFAVSNGFGSAEAEKEGSVSCMLRKGPIWGPRLRQDPDAPPASPIFSGRKAEASVANVDCSLYPSEGREDAQVTRFLELMQALARAARSG